MRRGRVIAPAALLLLLALPASAGAAAIEPVLAGPGDWLREIGSAIVGGLELGADFFSDLILNLLSGIVDLLIPDSWARKGMELLEFIVAAPDFTRREFAMVHELAGISLYLAMVMLPVTLAVGIGLPMLGASGAENTAEVLVRTALAATLVIFWTALFKQGPALANTVTQAYTSSGIAFSGMNAYMSVVAAGGLAGGFPLLGLLILFFAGLLFLGAIVLKVMLLLVGGLLFVTGPLVVALLPTKRGAQLGRLWLTALLTTWLLPALWGIIFVLAGTFMASAPQIGRAIGGDGLGAIVGMLLSGAAAIAAPTFCLGLSRSVLGPLGSQLGAHAGGASPGRLVARVGSGASRPGAVGGSSRAITSNATGAGGATGVMGRLTNSRISAAQAVRSGAQSLYSTPSNPTGNRHPLGSVKGFAKTAAAGGAGALAGVQAGRVIGRAQMAVAAGGSVGGAVKHAAGRATDSAGKVVGLDPASARADAARDAAAVAALRPSKNPPSTPHPPQPAARRDAAANARAAAAQPAPSTPGTSSQPAKAPRPSRPPATNAATATRSATPSKPAANGSRPRPAAPSTGKPRPARKPTRPGPRNRTVRRTPRNPGGDER